MKITHTEDRWKFIYYNTNFMKVYPLKPRSFWIFEVMLVLVKFSQTICCILSLTMEICFYLISTKRRWNLSFSIESYSRKKEKKNTKHRSEDSQNKSNMENPKHHVPLFIFINQFSSHYYIMFKQPVSLCTFYLVLVNHVLPSRISSLYRTLFGSFQRWFLLRIE